jgi:hypothetical protein
MSSHLPRRNLLLDALPEAAWKRLPLQLQWVQMPLDRVLHESGSEMAYAYFPTTAIVSLMYETEDSSPIELAVVGNEGIVGVGLFLGGGSTPSRAVVRSAGQAFRLPARAIKDEFDQAGAGDAPVALYPNAYQPDGADGGVQPASFAGAATMPLAADGAGSRSGQ